MVLIWVSRKPITCYELSQFLGFSQRILPWTTNKLKDKSEKESANKEYVHISTSGHPRSLKGDEIFKPHGAGRYEHIKKLPSHDHPSLSQMYTRRVSSACPATCIISLVKSSNIRASNSFPSKQESNQDVAACPISSVGLSSSSFFISSSYFTFVRTWCRRLLMCKFKEKRKKRSQPAGLLTNRSSRRRYLLNKWDGWRRLGVDIKQCQDKMLPTLQRLLRDSNYSIVGIPYLCGIGRGMGRGPPRFNL